MRNLNKLLSEKSPVCADVDLQELFIRFGDLILEDSFRNMCTTLEVIFFFCPRSTSVTSVSQSIPNHDDFKEDKYDE